MPFPPFLTGAPGPGGGGQPTRPPTPPGSGRKLALSVQRQSETDWCWSAVATSVALFYRPHGHWTQCRVADASLGRSDCCGPARSDPSGCNQPYYLDVALAVTGHFASMRPAVLSVAEVAAEIRAGRPIGCRIEWPGGSGHFLTIVGIGRSNSGTTYIDVSDPVFLDLRIAYQSFPVQYQGGAIWTHSYLTHDPPPAVALGGTGPSSNPLDPDAIGA